MSAPYVVMEFTASSGNHCRLKVYRPDTMQPVVDVTWDDSQSDADMKEADAFFADEMAKRHPGVPINVLGVDVPDDDIRQSMIQSYLRKGSSCNN